MILIITLVCSVAAAVLRGFQLANSFAPDQLIPSGDPVTITLMVLCGLVVAAAALYAFFGEKKKRTFPSLQNPLGNVWLIVEMLAAVAFFTASVGDLVKGIQDKRVSLICLGVLGLLASAAVLLMALSANRLKPNTATGFWFTIPVYWCCFLLFVDFTGFAGNPVRNAFMYGMLASIFCTLALNAAAGMFFGKAKRGRLIFFSLSAVFFASLTLGGSLFARVILNPETYPDAAILSYPEMLKLTFIFFHTVALVLAVQKGWLAPPEEPETPVSPPDEISSEEDPVVPPAEVSYEGNTVSPPEEISYEGGESV